MKKLIFSFMAIIPWVVVPTHARDVWNGTTDTDWEGSGTQTSPYLIGSAEELAGLAERANKNEMFEGVYFQLTSDVWLSDESMVAEDRINWIPIASHDIENDDADINPGGWNSKNNYFKGIFDGDGHTIYNLWFNGSTNFDDFNDPFGNGQIDFSAFNKALFGGLDGAVIKNLNLKNVNVNGAIVSGLAIEAHNSTFTDIYIDGHVKAGDLTNGGTAAGLVKDAYNCDFLRCESNVNVYSFSSPAPFVSYLRAGSKVVDCKASGSSTGCVYAAGFIGSSSEWAEGNDMRVPVIRNCSSSGLVTVIPGRNQGNSGAGFIGLNTGEIYNCHSNSDVNLQSHVGAGFCVDNRGRIESSYALGNVYSEDHGGSMSAFVQDNGLNAGWSEFYPGIVLNCYAAGSLSAPDAPEDIITMPTRRWGFCSLNDVKAGSEMANCYYDSTKNPDTFGVYPAIGSFGVSTEYMKSREFVDNLNAMAAVMGTTLWEYNPEGYPTCMDMKATAATELFAGGDGTEENPFIISNKKELENLAYATNRNWTFRNQHISQIADIELNAPFEMWGEEMPTEWTPIGELFDAGSASAGGAYHFCGTYDGQMHTVANMYIDNPEKMHCGLFGTLGKGAEIRNLGVKDAWMQCGSYSGIMAGSAGIHNEANQYAGTCSLTRCWTSGIITGGSPGGIIGYVPYDMEVSLNACYSTASASRAFIGETEGEETFVNGCWFAGRGEFNSGPDYFLTFIDQTVNPENSNLMPSMGVTTEYMHSAQFVNDLNYAAAYKGFAGGWRFNENNYPSFESGEEASAMVTLNDGINAPLSFKVIEGSSISSPISPEKEGEVCIGWYSDPEMKDIFRFGETQIKGKVELYARWVKKVTPDVSIFKNKFTNTYTIKTIGQLYGFASIVNGESTEVEKNDFTGKTVRLGNDIVLNDMEDFDDWGMISPVEFPFIGEKELNADPNPYPGNGFNGIFDGQGYKIVGLYMNCKEEGYTLKGFFRKIGPEGIVKNLILEKAYLNSAGKLYRCGLLAGFSLGNVTRCGVEGKIVDSNRDKINPGLIGGMIGLLGYSGYESSVSESYAKVEVKSNNSIVGGLVGSSSSGSNISDTYARGITEYEDYGNFGSILFSDNAGNAERSYGAVRLIWNNIPDNGSNVTVGGAYAQENFMNPIKNPLYYDQESLSEAFNSLGSPYSDQAYAKGVGLSSQQMMMMASFEGFDFEKVWGRRNDINDGYPYLRWAAPGLENDPDGPLPVESIIFSKERVVILEGESQQLNVEVLPVNSNHNLEWTSSNPGVAEVEKGIVYGKSAGITEITAAATDGSGVSAKCQVIVEANPVNISEIGQDSDDKEIFTLHGTLIFKGPFSDAKLPRGLYIARTSDGRIIKFRR